MKQAIGVLTVVLLLGCGSDNPLGSESLAGTYSLVSMEITEGGVTRTVKPPVIGTLVLAGTGSYTATFAGEGFTENDSGTFSVSGNTMVFSSADGSSTTATLSADRKTITYSETEAGITATMAFVRQ